MTTKWCSDVESKTLAFLEVSTMPITGEQKFRDWYTKFGFLIFKEEKSKTTSRVKLLAASETSINVI
jgi:hypothetical protein